MKYYEDLLEAGEGNSKIAFVLDAINEYKASELYDEASIAYEYFKRRNVTINQYQKLLYTLSGEAVPDNYSANYKFCNAFFPIFVKQENSFLLGNGVSFNDASTKDKLGGDDFDTSIYKAGEYSLWGGVSFCFFNFDHVDVFDVLEFAPLIGVEDGALHAGIRFWQVDVNKPLRATLYEEDGYTELIWRDGKGEVLNPKKAYTEIVKHTPADGDEIMDGENYPNFPIIPLWGNREHQTELTGLRSKIDGYDLIQSGFANDLDDASQIYWILNNAGGMDEVDLKKFMDQIKRVKAAVVEDDGARAEAHTLDIPYQARQAGLADLRDSLYRDAMALDTDKITAGNVTATAINSAYENLELKCDGYEYCVTTCIKALLDLLGIEDSPTYHRRKTTNQVEVTQMVMSAASELDRETILKNLPFINVDEIENIIKKTDEEELERFGGMMPGEDESGMSNTSDITEGKTTDSNTELNSSVDNNGNGMDDTQEEAIVDNAENVKGEALNGAQTQSLIMIMDKYSEGGLTEQQAINMISVAIAISKDDARKIVKGEK